MSTRTYETTLRLDLGKGSVREFDVDVEYTFEAGDGYFRDTIWIGRVWATPAAGGERFQLPDWAFDLDALTTDIREDVIDSRPFTMADMRREAAE